MALDNYVLHDVFEVLLVERDGAGAIKDTRFIGYTSETGFSQSIDQETIKAGIGNKTVAQIYKSKDVTFTLTNAVGSDSLLEIQTGAKFETVAQTLAVTERVTVIEKDGGAVVKLSKLPSEENDIVGDMVVLDNNNQVIQHNGIVFSSKEISLTDQKYVGKSVVVTYFVKKSSVEVLAISGETFPTAREIHARSVIYDNETNKIIANVHYIIPKAMPDGNIERSQSAGSNSNDSITFNALADEKGNYAYYVVEKLA